MNILIIGSGGREHAIAAAFKKSKRVTNIYFVGKNAGMDKFAHAIDININDNKSLVRFAKENKIDLTFVGGETPLLNGIVDEFVWEGLKIFGPRKAAAKIEGSKEFAKVLMKEAGVLTASYKMFSDYESALAYVKAGNFPTVIKYDGLAAGKGVVVAKTLEEADLALRDMLLGSKFGEAQVLIEEFLDGPEFSLMAFVNGDKVYPLEIAQDHKRAFDGDVGPNTGGMGAYSPVRVISDAQVKEGIDKILKPVAKEMVKKGVPFVGVLYAGLIATSSGVKVIEFNARFGDPETEVLLPRIENDFYDVIEAVLSGQDPKLHFSKDTFVGVVLASKGYPNSYEKNIELVIPDDLENSVYHMGTYSKDNKLLSSGGRVLFVLGKGKSLELAIDDAYMKVDKIKSGKLFFRTDIATKSC